MQEAVEAVHGKQVALACAADSVVINQMVFKVWGQHVVTKTVLQKAVATV